MWPELANARVRVRDSAYRLDLQGAPGCSAKFHHLCCVRVLVIVSDRVISYSLLSKPFAGLFMWSFTGLNFQPHIFFMSGLGSRSPYRWQSLVSSRLESGGYCQEGWSLEGVVARANKC